MKSSSSWCCVLMILLTEPVPLFMWTISDKPINQKFMKRNINSFLFMLLMLVAIGGCSEKEYSLGDLTAPSDVVVTTVVKGQDAAHPDGDGSGEVQITVSGKNAIAYKVDFDASDAVDLVNLPTGTITKQYAKDGVNTYRITAIAYGKGGTSTTVTKDVTVRSDFKPSEDIVNDLTGGSSKTWVVQKTSAGHF